MFYYGFEQLLGFISFFALADAAPFGALVVWLEHEWLVRHP